MATVLLGGEQGDNSAEGFELPMREVKEAIIMARRSLDQVLDRPLGSAAVAKPCGASQSVGDLVLATVPVAVRMVYGKEAGDSVEEALKTYNVKRGRPGDRGTKRKFQASEADGAEELDDGVAMVEVESDFSAVSPTEGSTPLHAALRSSPGIHRSGVASQRPSVWSNPSNQEVHTAEDAAPTLYDAAMASARACLDVLRGAAAMMVHNQQALVGLVCGGAEDGMESRGEQELAMLQGLGRHISDVVGLCDPSSQYQQRHCAQKTADAAHAGAEASLSASFVPAPEVSGQRCLGLAWVPVPQTKAGEGILLSLKAEIADVRAEERRLTANLRVRALEAANLAVSWVLQHDKAFVE